MKMGFMQNSMENINSDPKNISQRLPSHKAIIRDTHNTSLNVIFS